MFIVLDWDIDVKRYLLRCLEGLPEEDRPKRCGFCCSERRPHRHGKFMRSLYTVSDFFRIPIFRFLCFECRKSFCVVPSFVESYHQSGVDVKETVIQQVTDGCSIAEAAESSSDLAGGHYAEKTLWRWRKRWQERLDRHEVQLWRHLIHQGMERPLPRERHSRWRALRVAWTRSRSDKTLFQALLRLDRSPILSCGG